jgi:hypothetical protein
MLSRRKVSNILIHHEPPDEPHLDTILNMRTENIVVAAVAVLSYLQKVTVEPPLQSYATY